MGLPRPSTDWPSRGSGRGEAAPGEASLVNGPLTVASDCSARPPSVVNSDDLVVTAPTATSVVASATSGVDIVAPAGAVTIESDAGISGTDLATRSLMASTSSGDVVLRFTAPPGTVRSDTDSGDIEIVLPQDGTDYLVESDPPGSVRVRTDPNSPRVLRLRTASGDPFEECSKSLAVAQRIRGYNSANPRLGLSESAT